MVTCISLPFIDDFNIKTQVYFFNQKQMHLWTNKAIAKVKFGEHIKVKSTPIVQISSSNMEFVIN